MVLSSQLGRPEERHTAPTQQVVVRAHPYLLGNRCVREYEVQVEGGALEIRGVLSLSPEGGGVRLLWSERGDFGWNPLMGYAARGMGASQEEAMRSNLKTLQGLLDEVAPGEAG